MYFIALFMAILFVIVFVTILSKQSPDRGDDFKFEVISASLIIVFAALGLYLVGVVWTAVVATRRSLKVRDFFKKF